MRTLPSRLLSYLGTEIGSQCIIWKDLNACIPRHGFNLHHLPQKDCAELEIFIDDWFAIASLVSWLVDAFPTMIGPNVSNEQPIRSPSYSESYP